MLELPQAGKYAAIYADPPWRFKTYNEKGRQKCPDWRAFKGSPSLHYDTMSAQELRALPVGSIAAKDAALFMWFSWPMLEEAMQLITAWGFKYKTCAFSWTKAHMGQIDMFRDDADALMGTGYWTRANNESCLLATRGKPKRLSRSVRMGIIEPRREHSRKPDCVYSRIEHLVDGPYLEMFGRQRRANWDAWGNQVDKFQPVRAVA